MHQQSFAHEVFERYRREQFLRQMATVMPRRELGEVIEPFYQKPARVGRRPPKELEMMLRIRFLQH
jgi:hypothetical protein